MNREEKKAIKNTEQILKEWQKIVDIEDDMERDIEMNCYSEEMPFFEMKTLLKLVKKQEQEINKGKKFKKDIVDLIMLWDKKELPDNEIIISVLDTFVAEVSRLEDIEDRKIQVAVKFVEEKRDKYWKDKIQGKIKEKQDRIDKLHPASDMVIIDDLENQIDCYKDLLKEDNREVYRKKKGERK